VSLTFIASFLREILSSFSSFKSALASSASLCASLFLISVTRVLAEVIAFLISACACVLAYTSPAMAALAVASTTAAERSAYSLAFNFVILSANTGS